MPDTLISFLGIGLLVIGPILLVISLLLVFKKDNVASRLEEMVAEPILQQRKGNPLLVLQRRELRGSMLQRIFVPWVRAFGRLFGRMTPTGSMTALNRKLIIAGNPMGLEAREFFGIRVGIFLLGCFLAILILLTGIQNSLLFAGVTVAICALLPSSWLNGKVRSRQNQIRRGLPDALDMLSVCATAGLGFDQSLQRVSEHWQTPIGAEFARIISEMEMGLSRGTAMRNLADRLDVKEISSFVSFVLQTEQLGLSISDTLHSLAEQMRVERRFRAQEQAMKIPSKMLIPMAFLIFPALLAIILGPVVPSLVQFFNNF
ncbi:MAG: type II secretion system F family protein [Chloroflexi bacterium]|nr:MAG: type II secretion system F family protein [Chloroflexota bacterium]